MKKGSIKDSFNYAIEGVIEAVKSERNMKIHAIITVVMLILSLLCKLNVTETVMVVFAITLVWITELLNTAIESTIDIICKSYNKLAKKAKDVAAGAVLIAALNSVFIGYLVFRNKITMKVKVVEDIMRLKLQDGVVVILAVVVIIVILIKSYYNKGTPLKGGMPSGHSAVAASLWVVALAVSDSTKIFVITSVLALLVAQSRIEGKIHSIREVIIGALLGGLLTYVMLSILVIR